MPVPTGFDNKIIAVTGSPVAAGDLNTEIASLNGDDYVISDIKFVDANTALLLAGKAFGAAYGYVPDQKVNLVTADQASLDADKATEATDGYDPTGIFVTPGGALLVLYQLLSGSPA